MTRAYSKEEDWKDKQIAEDRRRRAKAWREGTERLREIHADILTADQRAREARRAGQREFGALVRKMRVACHLSLSEIARRVGVSAPFVSDIELGRRLPGHEVRDRMIAVLEDAR